MPFRFDLSALGGTLVDELVPLAADAEQPHEKPTEHETNPTNLTSLEARRPAPTGGVATLDGIKESDYPASFAVTWVLLVRSCCINRRSTDWKIADRFSRFVFFVSFALCFAACTIALLFQETIFIPKDVHWFGWVVFVVFVVTELLFLMARVLIGRFKNLMQRPEKAQGQDVGDLWFAIVSYTSFNDGLQAIVVTLLQLTSSATFIAGTLFMIMQADVKFEDNLNNTVALEYRYAWRVGWIVAFGLMTFGLCVCGWLDATRLGEVGDDSPHWQIELIAWRVLLLTLVLPVLHVAYMIFCSVCCDGPLIWS